MKPQRNNNRKRFSMTTVNSIAWDSKVNAAFLRILKSISVFAKQHLAVEFNWAVVTAVAADTEVRGADSRYAGKWDKEI